MTSVKVIKGSKVNVLADLTVRPWHADAPKTLVYGDQVTYTCGYGSTYYGWFIGKSPSGASTYMLSLSNHLINCKMSLQKFNWTSALSDIVTQQSYEEALAVLEEFRP